MFDIADYLLKEYGIKNISNDNNLKLGMVLDILQDQGVKLTVISADGVSSNDLVDEHGYEYENKIATIPKKGDHFTIDVSIDCLGRYRTAHWIFSIFNGLTPLAVFYIEAFKLQLYFDKWEADLMLLPEKARIKALPATPRISFCMIFNYGKCLYVSDEGKDLIANILRKRTSQKAYLATKAMLTEAGIQPNE